MKSQDEVVARFIGTQKRVLVAARDRAETHDMSASPDEQPQAFDVVCIRDFLAYATDMGPSLDDLLRMLKPGGTVIAVIPNALHGAVALRMLGGGFDFHLIGVEDESYVPFLTASTLRDLFLSCGLNVDAVERVRRGIFENAELLDGRTREDFDERLVAEIERDPESDTLQFVVKAHLLAPSERHHAIIRRLEQAHAQAFSTRRTLRARADEVVRLQSAIVAARRALEEYAIAPLPEPEPIRAAALAAPEVAAELQRALVRNEHLSQRADEAERQLAELLEGLIVATQAESARLALLIDTVQSSRFWKLKRLAARLLRRGQG